MDAEPGKIIARLLFTLYKITSVYSKGVLCQMMKQAIKASGSSFVRITVILGKQLFGMFRSLLFEIMSLRELISKIRQRMNRFYMTNRPRITLCRVPLGDEAHVGITLWDSEKKREPAEDEAETSHPPSSFFSRLRYRWQKRP